MNLKILVLVLVIILAACSSTSNKSEFKAENLIQKFPLPEGDWDVYQREPEGTNMLETRWVSKTSDDLAQTFVMYNTPNGDPQRTMDSDHKVGKKNCDILFQSDLVSNEVQNGYPQLTWQSECKSSNGYYSKTIHKTISGNDSQYAFKRIFKSKPSDESWQLWLSYASSIEVCDSRSNQHPCPEGYKKVE